MTAGQIDKWKRDALALLSRIDHNRGAAETGESLHHRLSPREREVMDLLLNGHRLKEIAAMLDISVKTVTTHRARLLRKLRLSDNLGLYRYGIRHGLISV